MNASAPDAPVMPAWEGSADDIQRSSFEQIILFLKTAEELIFGTHGAVKDPERRIEYIR